LPGEAIDGLMKRNFAPPAERLKSVIARLKAIPALLQAMKDNIKEPPPQEFNDLAIRMAGGSIGFFKGTVRDWAEKAAAGDRLALREFDAINAAAVAALEDALKWLKTAYVPDARPTWAI